MGEERGQGIGRPRYPADPPHRSLRDSGIEALDAAIRQKHAEIHTLQRERQTLETARALLQRQA